MDEEEESRKKNKELLDAVEKGDEELVKVFLLENKNKLDINFKFKDKVSSKLVFSLFSLLSFISFLFLLCFIQDGMTALQFAADKGFKEIVKILVEHGSNVDLQVEVLIFILFLFFFIFYLLLWVHCWLFHC